MENGQMAKFEIKMLEIDIKMPLKCAIKKKTLSTHFPRFDTQKK
jgi:hypothetical protein